MGKCPLLSESLTGLMCAHAYAYIHMCVWEIRLGDTRIRMGKCPPLSSWLSPVVCYVYACIAHILVYVLEYTSICIRVTHTCSHMWGWAHEGVLSCAHVYACIVHICIRVTHTNNHIWGMYTHTNTTHTRKQTHTRIPLPPPPRSTCTHTHTHRVAHAKGRSEPGQGDAAASEWHLFQKLFWHLFHKFILKGFLCTNTKFKKFSKVCSKVALIYSCTHTWVVCMYKQ